jgi:hypothetical protein
MAENDKKRHIAQVEEMGKNGFFIMQDGSKSTDHEKKVKLGKRKLKDRASQSEDLNAEIVTKKQKKA